MGFLVHPALLPGDAHGTDGAVHLLGPHFSPRQVNLRLEALRATVGLGHAGHLQEITMEMVMG